jgi:hypothetical protein
LNKAIDDIKYSNPTQWTTILNYIDSCATMPHFAVNSLTITDNSIARVAAHRQGSADIYYRLAQLKEKKGEE